MTKRIDPRILALPALVLATALAGCPLDGGGGGPDAGLPDVTLPDASPDAAAYACGSIDHMDDPAEFVGSCIGPTDSNGDFNCVQYTTIPLALVIGTECLRQICANTEGASWTPDGCPGGMTFCISATSDDLTQDYYASNPIACTGAE